MPVVKVFISSVMKGMEPYRDAVTRAIEDMSMVALRFEAFPASSANPEKIAREEVKNADIFVQLVGEHMSEAVEKEYNAALEYLPDRILVFVKEVALAGKAKEHFERLSRNHTYKKFTSPADLEKQVPYAINSLVASTLSSKEERRGRMEEVLIEQTARLECDAYLWEIMDLRSGDRLKGLIKGTDTFHVFFLDEEEYAGFLNDMQTVMPIKKAVRAFAMDKIVRKDDTYYLIVYCCAWLGTKVSIFLKRLREPRPA